MARKKYLDFTEKEIESSKTSKDKSHVRTKDHEVADKPQNVSRAASSSCQGSPHKSNPSSVSQEASYSGQDPPQKEKPPSVSHDTSSSCQGPPQKKIKINEDGKGSRHIPQGLSTPQSLSASVNDKLDEILNILKGKSVQGGKQQRITGYGPLDALNQEKVVDWSQITNLIDLVDAIEQVRFFPGDKSGLPGCIRCEPCYNYLCHTTNKTPREHAVISTKK